MKLSRKYKSKIKKYAAVTLGSVAVFSMTLATLKLTDFDAAILSKIQTTLSAEQNTAKSMVVADDGAIICDSIVQGIRDYDLADGEYTLRVTGNDGETIDYEIELYNYTEDTVYSLAEGTTTTTISLGNDTADERMLIVKYHKNLTIDTGVTLTATTRKKGMYICVLGDLENNGTITMTARGAIAEGENVYLWKNNDGTYEYVPAAGGLGGAGVKRTSAGVSYNNGKVGTKRSTGGGGSGGAVTNTTSTSYLPTSGSGSAGTSYSGGSGGGSATYATVTAGSAEPNGGAGGNSYTRDSTTYSATGGTGNAGGTGELNGTTNATYKGTTGTGGLLILYADNMYNKGVISSNGTNANNTLGTTSANRAATGGASGAGSVNIFANKFYASTATNVQANGGTSAKGGAGGAGSVTITEVGQYLNYDEKEIEVKVGNSYTFSSSKFSYELYEQQSGNTYAVGTLDYSVEDTSIASITSGGKLVGIKEGNTKVIVTDTRTNKQTQIYVKIVDTQTGKVEAGENFTAVLKEDGTVWTWGQNANGQLGISSTTDNLEPIRVGDVVYSKGYTDYIETTVVAEGLSLDRTVGNEIDNRTIKNDSNYLKDVKDIAVGKNHILALTNTGKVYSWGKNANGQLGNGTTEDSNEATMLGLTNIVKIDANKNTSSALTEDGKVYMWGEGYSTTPTIVDLSLVTGNVVDIAGNIVLTDIGTVYTIGYSSETFTLTKVNKLSEIAKISAGENHYLALDTTGNAYAWGDNTYGQLGRASASIENICIVSLANIYDISAGKNSSMFITNTKEVYVCGDNTDKKIGITDAKITVPTKIDRLVNIEAVSAGEGNHSIAMDGDGWLYLTGINTYGQLGFNDKTAKTTYTKLGETKIGLNKVLYNNRLFLNYKETEELKAKVINTINLKTDIVSTNVKYSIDKPEVMSINANKLTVDTYGEVKLTITNEDETLTKEVRVVTYLQLKDIVQGVKDFDIPDGNQTIVVVGNDNELVDYDVEMINYQDNMTYTENTLLGNDEKDSRMLIVKYHKDLKIGKGITLTATTRKKGMYICVLGNTYNEGTITMTARGAVAEGQNVYLWKNDDNTYEYVPAVGGLGGASAQIASTGTTYNNGKAGTARQTGGGGSGGSVTNSSSYRPKSGAGSAGTSYSGGSGGGSGIRSTGTAGNAGANGGAGGNAVVSASTSTSRSATGGTGNPGGNGALGTAVNTTTYKGTTGTGGLLIMYSNEIYNKGVISSNGTNANNTLASTNANYCATGGASGAGSVNVFCNIYYKGTQADLTANGGTSAKGGSGGAGSVTLVQLQKDMNYKDKEISLLVGNNYTIDTTKLTNENGENVNLSEITFTSEQDEIASVSEAGIITANKLGKTKVILTDSENKTETAIYVNVTNKVEPKVEAGENFTVALKEDGTVWAWGQNTSGQLGISSTTDNLEPIRVGDKVYPYGYAGYLETTVVAEGLSLEKNFGNEIDNRIEENDDNYLKNVINIAAGYNHAMALTNEGKVYVWGDNQKGQLGTATGENALEAVSLDLENIVAIDANKNMSIALNKDGEVYIWGENYTNIPSKIDNTKIEGKVIAISGNIVLTENGTVYAIKVQDNIESIEKVSGLNKIAKISAGENHYLALNVRGEAYAWGDNTYGQLGNTTNTNGSAIMVSGIKDVYEIYAGNKNSMFITKTQEVYACGDNSNSKIGLTGAKITVPTKVEALSNIETISAGEGNHTIAMASDGYLYGVGLNTNGQLGLNDITARTTYTKIGETKIGLNKVLYNNKLYLNYKEVEELKAKVINTINLKTDIVSTNVNYSVDNPDIMSLNGNKLSVDNYGEIKLTITNEDGSLTKEVRVVTYLQQKSIVQGVKDFDIPDGKQTLVIVGENNELKDYDIEMINYYDDMTYTTNTSLGNDEKDARMLVVKYHKNLNIASGVKLTATTRKKGMYICVLGTTQNEGTITMTARGAVAVGENVYLWKNVDGSFEYVPAEGGNGGAGVKRTAIGISYNNGKAGINRSTGGGGSGGASTNSTSYLPTSGSGSAGTSYSGGSGGGAATYITATAGNASPNGGAGGNSYTRDSTTYSATGGTGNAGGTGELNGSTNATYKGTEGTGGLLIVYSNEMYNKGVISSNGTDANNTLGTTSVYRTATGGASGGGSVNVFTNKYYKGSEVDLTATGGNSTHGGNGGNGSTNLIEIGESLNYPEKELELKVGESYNFEASKLTYSYVSELQAEQNNVGSIKYEILDETIASITQDGNLVAKSEGTTKVKITNEEKDDSTYVYVKVLKDTDVQMAVGNKFSVVLKNNGTVWTWGDNSHGQLGIGSTNDNLYPVRVGDNIYPDGYEDYIETTVIAEDMNLPDKSIGNKIDNNITQNPDDYLQNIKQISAGEAHVLALSKDGILYAWGAGEAGQLGTGANNDETSPVKLSIPNIKKINAYKNISTAIDEDGKLYICGENYSNTFIEVDTLGNKIVQTAGDIVLAENGKVYKIVKQETDENETITLEIVAGMYSISKISAGENHYLALNTEGSVYAWGDNTYGQLGNKTNTSGKPLLVANVTNVYEISAGSKTSMFINSQKELYACGENTNTKLGLTGTTIQEPTIVKEVTRVERVATGYEHSIAMNKDGDIYEVGLNDKGQLGFRDNTTRTTFTKLNQVKIATNKLTYHDKLFINLGYDTEIKAKVINTINLKNDIIETQNLKYAIDDETIMSLQGNVLTPIHHGEVKLTITNEDESITKEIIVVTYVEYGSIVQGVKDNNLPDGNQTIVIQGLDNELMTYGAEVVNYYDDMTYTSNTSLGNSVEDERMLIVKYHKNLNVNSGVTLTATTRKKGMYICVLGNIENNGTITMTARGAKAEGENVYLWKNINGSFEYVPAVGAPGGAGIKQTVKGTSYNSGKAGTARSTGGGGSGGAATNNTSYLPTSGSGSAGTSYSGGSGGGAVARVNATAANAGENGGAGGRSYSYSSSSYSATGGTGNPGGTGVLSNSANSAYAGTTGTGGLLIVYADELYNNGQIASKGTDANNKLATTSANYTATGGASGGGSVNIFVNKYYKGSDTDTSVVGGKSVKGGSGGAGTVSIMELSQNLNSEEKQIQLTVGNTHQIDKNKLSYITQLQGETPLTVGTLKYSIDNEEVAKVTEDGVITAIKAGKTKVKIEDLDNDESTYIYINVIDGIRPQVALGENFTIALKTNGTIWAFGKNDNGQLGLGDTANRVEPVQVESLNDITKISAGYGHVIALDKKGNIYTWGSNDNGQLGVGNYQNSEEPVKLEQFTNGAKIVDIDANKNNTMLLTEDGKLYAWGEDFSSIPTEITIKENVIAISGDIILTSSGYVYKLNNLQQPISGLKDIAKISAGENHYLALNTAGKVFAWGDNTYGQLGNVSNVSGAPALVLQADETYDISAGKYTSLLLSKNEEVYAFGNNANGQLGIVESKAVKATKVTGIANVESVVAGATHSAIIKEDGFVYLTGTNTYGELGNPEIKNSVKVFTQLGERVFVTEPKEVLIGISETIQMSAVIKNTFNLKIDIIDENNMVYTSQKDDILSIVNNNVTGLKYGEDVITVTNTITNETTTLNARVVLSSESIVQAVRDNELDDGDIYIKVEDEVYPVELYNYYDDVTYTANTSLGNSTADERMLIVKYHKNLTINNGVKVTATTRKKGMYICVLGELTNNGEISMTSRGAIAEGQNVYLWKNKDNTYEYVPAVGGNGGNGITLSKAGVSYGIAGTNGTSRATGGGGSGGATMHNSNYTSVSGSGSAGTSYSGGTGGGASVACTGNSKAGNATPNGGAGGNADTGNGSVSATGGTGNAGGNGEYRKAVNTAYNGTTGTGGLLIVYASELNNNGKLTSNGTNANNKLYTTSTYHAATGGASGAGSINIFTNKYNATTTSDVQAVGGSSTRGGNGGNGSITITELNYLNYPEKEITLKQQETYTIDKEKLSNETLDNTNEEILKVGNIVYTSLDENVAQVSDNGVITAVKEGKTRIEIQDTTNGTKTYITIVVSDVGTSKLELGDAFSVSLKADHTVWTFGSNSNGQLGDGTTENKKEPVQVITKDGKLENIVDIGAGLNHAIAVDNTGKVYTWGLVKLDQNSENLNVATLVEGLENIVKVDAFANISTAVDNLGNVYIWGEGYDTITKIEFTKKVVDVSGKYMLTEDGKVYNITTLERVPYLTNIAKISAGTDHVLVLTTRRKCICFW